MLAQFVIAAPRDRKKGRLQDSKLLLYCSQLEPITQGTINTVTALMTIRKQVYWLSLPVLATDARQNQWYRAIGGLHQKSVLSRVDRTCPGVDSMFHLTPTRTDYPQAHAGLALL